MKRSKKKSQEDLEWQETKNWFKEWGKRDVPANLWLWIIALAFFVGIFVGANYYSAKANNAVQDILDEIYEIKQMERLENEWELLEKYGFVRKNNTNDSRDYSDEFLSTSP